MTRLVLMGRTGRKADMSSHAGVQQAQWHTGWVQTGSSGQRFTVIGRCSLICESDKERRKETCRGRAAQITKEKEYVCDSMLITLERERLLTETC